MTARSPWHSLASEMGSPSSPTDAVSETDVVRLSKHPQQNRCEQDRATGCRSIDRQIGHVYFSRSWSTARTGAPLNSDSITSSLVLTCASCSEVENAAFSRKAVADRRPTCGASHLLYFFTALTTAR